MKDSRVSKKDIAYDIEELQQKVENLQAKLQLFQIIADWTYDWEYLIDPDGRVVYMSPSCERITGYRPQEFMDDPELLNRIIHPEDSQAHDAGIRQMKPVTEALQQTHEEFRVLAQDGSEHWIDYICRPVFAKDGGYLGNRVSNREITVRKKMESELKAKTKSLERSNKDLEQFAFVAAHDLREPLIGVAANLKLLDRRAGKALDKQAKAFLSKAIETAVRMDFLIQSLLAYSRVGTDTEELKPTDFNWCLSQALANLSSAMEESGAAVTSDSLPTLTVRPSQFIRVFQNLIGNAIKFRALEPLKVHIGLHVLESEYQFSVRDNGLGIEQPHVERIFELFQRAHESSELSGTGIGLASCKTIVERHGGRIWVDSEKGKGSTFFFTLPRS